MLELIGKELREIEQRERVKILLAAESGSRAWGFASPDSDYDVRFFYVRPREEYLKLEKRRDVIELPLSDVLDINGWDLDKALRLLHSSNPTMLEWFASPIVYRDSEFRQRMQGALKEYFSVGKSLHHYLSMAKGNRQDHLRGEQVKAKKYFYVLRPILACLWIMDRRTPPPILFDDLCAAYLDESVKPEVDRLLEIKRNLPEIGLIDRVERLHAYIDAKIALIEEYIAALPKEEAKDWKMLDEIFLDETSRL